MTAVWVPLALRERTSLSLDRRVGFLSTRQQTALTRSVLYVDRVRLLDLYRLRVSRALSLLKRKILILARVCVCVCVCVFAGPPRIELARIFVACSVASLCDSLAVRSFERRFPNAFSLSLAVGLRSTRSERRRRRTTRCCRRSRRRCRAANV